MPSIHEQTLIASINSHLQLQPCSKAAHRWLHYGLSQLMHMSPDDHAAYFS